MTELDFGHGSPGGGARRRPHGRPGRRGWIIPWLFDPADGRPGRQIPLGLAAQLGLPGERIRAPALAPLQEAEQVVAVAVEALEGEAGQARLEAAEAGIAVEG